MDKYFYEFLSSLSKEDLAKLGDNLNNMHCILKEVSKGEDDLKVPTPTDPMQARLLSVCLSWVEDCVRNQKK